MIGVCKLLGSGLLATALLTPSISIASDDVREMGRAAEKLARAYNIDETLHNFIFGGLSNVGSNANSASLTSSSKTDSNRSKFRIKGIKRLEYKYGNRHRINIDPNFVNYRFTISF